LLSGLFFPAFFPLLRDCVFVRLRRPPSSAHLFEWHPGRPFIGFGRPPARLHTLQLQSVKLMHASGCPLQLADVVSHRYQVTHSVRLCVVSHR
jgi:hypothetical protein